MNRSVVVLLVAMFVSGCAVSPSASEQRDVTWDVEPSRAESGFSGLEWSPLLLGGPVAASVGVGFLLDVLALPVTVPLVLVTRDDALIAPFTTWVVGLWRKLLDDSEEEDPLR